MNQDELLPEERAVLDKLNYFYDNKIKVHLKLHKNLPDGRRIFYNGILIEKNNDTIWVLNEKVLGNITISLYEIKEIEQMTQEEKIKEIEDDNLF